MNRFQDQNLRLSAFENEIDVSCPKCAQKAVVTKDDPTNDFSARSVNCRNCVYTQTAKNEAYQIELKCTDVVKDITRCA